MTVAFWLLLPCWVACAVALALVRRASVCIWLAAGAGVFAAALFAERVLAGEPLVGAGWLAAAALHAAVGLLVHHRYARAQRVKAGGPS